MIQDSEINKVWFRIISKDYERVIDLNKIWSFRKYILNGKWYLVLRFGNKSDDYFEVDDEKIVVKIYDELLTHLHLCEKRDWFRIISKNDDRVIDLNKIWSFKKGKEKDGHWYLTLLFGAKKNDYLEINDQSAVFNVYNELVKRFELEVK